MALNMVHQLFNSEPAKNLVVYSVGGRLPFEVKDVGPAYFLPNTARFNGFLRCYSSCLRFLRCHYLEIRLGLLRFRLVNHAALHHSSHHARVVPRIDTKFQVVVLPVLVRRNLAVLFLNFLPYLNNSLHFFLHL